MWKGRSGDLKRKRLITYCKLQKLYLLFSHTCFQSTFDQTMENNLFFLYFLSIVWLRKTGTNIWFIYQTCFDSKKEKSALWKCIRLLTSGQAQGLGTLLSLFLQRLRTLRDLRQCMMAVGRLLSQFSDTSSSCSFRRPIQFVPEKHKQSRMDTYQSLQNTLDILFGTLFCNFLKKEWLFYLY